MTTDKAEGRDPPGGSELAVSVRGVRKRFGYRDVLRGIDLDVARGGCFVISGSNGAGKSTLLRIVATQWGFSAGEVRVLGRDVRREGIEVKRRIGLVFHDNFLRRELTLEENLRFASDLHGLREAASADRIASLIERFGIAHRRNDRVGTFSRGMIQRANLARSLLNEPELWILDEPFTGLDPEGQDLLTTAIQEFAAQRGTVVLVTHQISLGARLATASAHLVDGTVARQGPGGSGLAGAEPVSAAGSRAQP